MRDEKGQVKRRSALLLDAPTCKHKPGTSYSVLHTIHGDPKSAPSTPTLHLTDSGCCVVSRHRRSKWLSRPKQVKSHPAILPSTATPYLAGIPVGYGLTTAPARLLYLAIRRVGWVGLERDQVRRQATRVLRILLTYPYNFLLVDPG